MTTNNRRVTPTGQAEGNNDNLLPNQDQFNELVVNGFMNDHVQGDQGALFLAPLMPQRDILQDIPNEEDTGPEAGEPLGDPERVAQQNPDQGHNRDLENAIPMVEQQFPILENRQNPEEAIEEALDRLQRHELNYEEARAVRYFILNLQEEGLLFDIKEKYPEDAPHLLQTNIEKNSNTMIFKGSRGCGIINTESMSLFNPLIMSQELDLAYREGYPLHHELIANQNNENPIDEETRKTIVRDFLDLKIRDIDCTKITLHFNVKIDTEELNHYRNEYAINPICEYVKNELEVNFEENIELLKELFPENMLEFKFVTPESTILFDTNGNLEVENGVDNTISTERLANIQQLAREEQEYQLRTIVNSLCNQRAQGQEM